VAERGGFGAATSKLHLSQSRVSAHISALEEMLGFALFERRVRPTALTEPGRIFADHAREALDALQDGIEAARAALRPGYGHLVVGSYPSVSATFLPSVLACLNASTRRCPSRFTKATPRHSRRRLRLRRGRHRVPAVAAPGPRQSPDDEATMARIDRRRDARRRSFYCPDARQRSRSRGTALIGNPSGDREDGGGFDLRHVAGEAADLLNVAYLTDQPSTLVSLVASRVRDRRHQPARSRDDNDRRYRRSRDRFADGLPGCGPLLERPEQQESEPRRVRRRSRSRQPSRDRAAARWLARHTRDESRPRIRGGRHLWSRALRPDPPPHRARPHAPALRGVVATRAKARRRPRAALRMIPLL